LRFVVRASPTHETRLVPLGTAGNRRRGGL